MTHYTQTDLDVANGYVAQCECHIVQQEALITRLRLQSRPIEDAEELLEMFNSTLAGHRRYLAAIVTALADGRRDRGPIA